MLFDAALHKQSNKGFPCKSGIHLHQKTQQKNNQPQRTKFGVMAANQSQFWMDRILPVGGIRQKSCPTPANARGIRSLLDFGID